MQLPYVSTAIQIRFSDLDLQGHVSNSVYMQYFDMGRIDFFTEIEKNDAVPNNVVANITIDMLHEIRLFDQVRVDTWCTRVGKKSMTVQQHIFANDKVVTKATLVLVGFDRDTRTSAALPQHWLPSAHP